MKFKYIKSIVSAALFLSLTTGITSCINDLDISPIDPQMTATFDQDMYFTKLYASLGLTGQKLSEDPDIAVKDEGQSCFYRALFTNNEYGTDEMIWTWQENAGIPELTYMRWNSSHQQTEILYNRLAYNITLCNFFLDQIAGKEDATSVQQRAEARFLRSLFYYYLMDTFGKAPFTEHFSKENPPQKTASELFAYIESELESIENDMSEPRQAPFGRADKAACWLLRARLYLNAEYTPDNRVGMMLSPMPAKCSIPPMDTDCVEITNNFLWQTMMKIPMLKKKSSFLSVRMVYKQRVTEEVTS